MTAGQRSLKVTIALCLMALLLGDPVDAAASGGGSAAPPPAELLCGVPATATIVPGGQQHDYTFVGAPGDQVYVTLLKTGGDTGFAPFAWTDHPVSPGMTAVKVQQVLELRQAVDEVYLALARATPIYADAVLTAGTTAIKAVHVAEIRAAIIAIW